jgi:hypothetical protein
VIKPPPRVAPPRAIRREPERAGPRPEKRRSLSFRALDDEGLKNLYNAVMAEKMRRSGKKGQE